MGGSATLLTSGPMSALWEGVTRPATQGQEPLPRRTQGPRHFGRARSVLPHYQLRLPALEVCEYTAHTGATARHLVSLGPVEEPWPPDHTPSREGVVGAPAQSSP